MVTYWALLAFIGLERLNELRLSRRNARLALAAGGVEFGHRHYRVMTVVHALFLGSCAAEPLLLHRAAPVWLSWLSFALVVGAQALRAWAILSLGDRWNTRVIIWPDAPPVTRGPYRFLKHPNYTAVIIELAFLPLMHGAWLTAIVFSLANAALLAVRIRVEERALGPVWAQAFAGRHRFVPGATHV